MKTKNLLIGVAIIGAGFVVVSVLSKKKAAAAATTTTAAAAPGSSTIAGILGYVSEADQLFGFLNSTSSNTASTNSTSGVSASGAVSTTSPVAGAYQEASDLWDLYG